MNEPVVKNRDLRVVVSELNEDAWDTEGQRYSLAELRRARLVWMLTFVGTALGFAMVGMVDSIL